MFISFLSFFFLSKQTQNNHLITQHTQAFESVHERYSHIAEQDDDVSFMIELYIYILEM